METTFLVFLVVAYACLIHGFRRNWRPPPADWYSEPDLSEITRDTRHMRDTLEDITRAVEDLKAENVRLQRENETLKRRKEIRICQ